MNRILISGISGFLGWHLAKLMAADHEVHGIYFTNIPTIPEVHLHQLDICDNEKLVQLIRQIRPSGIMHLAAYSSLNSCETMPEYSHRVNVTASARLANAAAGLSIPFLFTSTDMIFDGLQPPYFEDDIPSPIHNYGRQKAEAEQLILHHYPQALVVRLPLLYGFCPGAKNFMQSWVENLKAGLQIFAFTDEYRNPLNGVRAAEGLKLLWSAQASGIWHLGGKDYCSRYDFAMKISEAFDLPKALIVASKQNDVESAAQRPQRLRLDFAKAAAAGFEPLHIEEELTILKREFY